MKVVIDTNVLFSALISPHGAPDKIYRAWRSGCFFIVTSQMQLEEIRKASRYPKFKDLLEPAKVGAMLNNLHRSIVLDHLIIEFETNDPEDSFLLSMAKASEADYLITGDRRSGLLQRKNLGRSRILTPTDFCKEVCKIS